MALDACVKAVLCPLGNTVLSAFNGIITAQVTFLQAEVTFISATLISLQIQLLPLQAVKGLVDAALAAVKSAANLVPVALMNNCLDLGISMQGINNSLDDATASANKKLDEINRSLSYTAELEAKRDAINATIAQLNDLKATISSCT